MTRGIKISCTNKRLLKILALKTTNPIITNYYKKYEKILKNLVTASKKIQYVNKIKKSNNKVKTMWSIINERTNKKLKKDQNNIKLQIDQNFIDEPKKVANIFNNFFASIGENSANSSSSRPGNTSVLNPTENTMFLGPIDAWEVNKIIKNLKNKISHGIDEIPPMLLRQCADELTLPFYLLLNQSFDEGIFPDLLKISVIKPIHKRTQKQIRTTIVQ